VQKIITYASGSSTHYYHEKCFEETLKKLSMRIGDTGYNATIGMVSSINIKDDIVCVRCGKDVKN
jgi:hypothetical protein